MQLVAHFPSFPAHFLTKRYGHALVSMLGAFSPEKEKTNKVLSQGGGSRVGRNSSRCQHPSSQEPLLPLGKQMGTHFVMVVQNSAGHLILI